MEHDHQFILVIRRSVEYLTVSEAMNLLLLNKKIRNNLENAEFFEIVSKKIISQFSTFDQRDPIFFRQASKIVCFPVNSFEDLYRCVKNS